MSALLPTCRRQAPLAALCCLLATPVAGVQFDVGPLQGRFDSALSLSTAVSTANPDKQQLQAANGNDGRRNYRSGDVFSVLFKGTHDLEVRRGNLGVFLRGSYWYDTAQRDHSQRAVDIDDRNRLVSAKTAGAELLDAFAYGLYDIAGEPGSLRVGKQVVNWGKACSSRAG